jgi:hypothetical protein
MASIAGEGDEIQHPGRFRFYPKIPGAVFAFLSVKRISVVIALSILIVGCSKGAPPLAFLSKTYSLASFNQKNKPQWEFVTGGETVDNWTTLLTLIDRADAKTAPDLDRLAEGVMQTYKSNGGRILLAKTMKDKAGVNFNYMVAAFEEPAKNRFELNFIKFALGPKNAYIMIYGTRVADPKDYKTKGKEFLNQHSEEIGRAVENAVLPDLSTLSRKEF